MTVIFAIAYFSIAVFGINGFQRVFADDAPENSSYLLEDEPAGGAAASDAAPDSAPEASEPESSEPESSQPESSEPESSEPESSESESNEPESSEPESSEPESSEPESSEPESSEPESSEPESSEPESSEPEVKPPPKATSYYGTAQADIETRLLERINDFRHDLGLAPLTYSNSLTNVSHIRAGEMAQNNYFDHARPDGAMWYTVLQENGLCPSLGYENIARSKGECANADDLFYAWINSPEHYAIMTHSELTTIGIGVVYAQTPDGLSTYACTTFASF